MLTKTLRFAILLLIPPAISTADEPLIQAEVVKELRGITTNVQFNRDETVRLVRLSNPMVEDKHLARIAEFLTLDYLAVVAPQVTDEGVRSLAGLTNLDTLLLSTTGVTDAGLASLAKLEKLERLYLDRTAVTDDGLASLASLKNLRVLSLEGTQVTSGGLKHLEKLPKLETLLLADTQVGDAGLAHLAKLPELQYVDLTHTPITSAGVAHLEPLEKLEHLTLRETKVDDAVVSSLARMKSLKQVELHGADVGGEVRAKLQAEHPNLGIYPAPSTATASRKPEVKPAVEVVAKATPVLPPARERFVAGDGDDAPDFQRHVGPLLGRLGCNGRACHGSFQGQGGFQLSMFGYDFEMDHKNLLERVDLESPKASLILNKPATADEHEGGLRLPPGGWEQALLRNWIEAGAKGVATDSARMIELKVEPAEIVFSKAGQTRQLKAIAVWSDGTREDVTCLTRFQTNDDAVAEVNQGGLVTATGKGDTYIISFYDNGVVSTGVLSPVSDLTAGNYPQLPTPTKIDEHVAAKLAKLGIVPSELSSDEDFLRRVSLDMIGTLPTPSQIAEFVADDSPDKREKKIDELLETPAYVAWWTQRLCDLTGSNAGYLGSTEMAQPTAEQWRSWLERRVRDNTGWDEIARGILMATSRRPNESYRDFIARQSEFTRTTDPVDFTAPGNPMPHFWYRDNISQPEEKALSVGYIFLGVRLQCAQCHKHPFDQWSKQDFEQFTAFFTRIKSGVAPDALAYHTQMREQLGVPTKLDTAALRRQSYLRIAAEGRSIPWNEIWIERPEEKGQTAKLLGGEQLNLAEYDDPRVPLMEWMLNDPQRLFAKAFVNRIWASYFNVGIIEPPDDLNLANPPSNKALLDYLTSEFIAHGYDIKWLHKEIANSRTYQLSWRPTETNRADGRNFSRAVVRRLPAEVAIDAIALATAGDKQQASFASDTSTRKISAHPRSYQARTVDYSLLIFGKPLRTTNCDCERQSEPTLLQSIYIRNDVELLEQLDRPGGWLNSLTAQKEADRPPVDELIRTAYTRTLSRPPSESELVDCRRHLQDAQNVVDGLRDLLWALLNTQEFITNH